LDDRPVPIVECRRLWDPEKMGPEWTRVPVATLRYTSSRTEWTLYRPDRNSTFHRCDLAQPTTDLVALLDEIDRDPTSIFWGIGGLQEGEPIRPLAAVGGRSRDRLLGRATQRRSLRPVRRLARTRRRELRQPAFEEAPFGTVVGELPRTSVGVTRLIHPPEAS